MTNFIALPALLVLAIAPAAAAEWAPVPVGGFGSQTTVAVSPGATPHAAFAWTRYDDRYAVFEARGRVRSESGELSTALRLSTPGEPASQPDVAIDAGGDAVFAWVAFSGSWWRPQARVRSAGGALRPIHTLTPYGVTGWDVRAALDGAGNAFLVWNVIDSTGGSRVRGRVLSSAGELGPVAALGPPESGACGLAVDGARQAIVAWTARVDGVARVQTRRWSADGTLTPIRNVSPAAESVGRCGMATNGAGDAVFAWMSGDRTAIRARVQEADGSFRSVHTVSGSSGNVSSFDVAMVPDGTALFAWTRTRYQPAVADYIDLVQARSLAPTGVLGSVQTLARGDIIVTVRMAADAAGNAVHVWGEDPGFAARRRRGDGTLERVDRFPEGGSQPVVAGNDEGVAVLIGSALTAYIGP